MERGCLQSEITSSVGRTNELNNLFTSFAGTGHPFSTHQLNARTNVDAMYCARRSGGIWPAAFRRIVSRCPMKNQARCFEWVCGFRCAHMSSPRSVLR